MSLQSDVTNFDAVSLRVDVASASAARIARHKTPANAHLTADAQDVVCDLRRANSTMTSDCPP